MRSRWSVASAFVLTMVVSDSARTEEPLFIGWSEILPGLTARFDPSSENICKKGHVSCVNAVIREMDRRSTPVAEACDHDVLFAITYLRTTEVYRQTIEDPAFFEDTAFVNHEDAVFGEYYFSAYDAWHGQAANGRGTGQDGDTILLGYTNQAVVPPAWAIAFSAADNRSVKAIGNVLLGMNAHIQRDLPFVLYSIGLVKPDGSSRKPDHDKVNEFLARVVIFPELARRFDPTVDDSNVPGTTVDDLLSFQIVPAWREIAWRNAERLAAAANDVERAQVAQSIEDYAASQAMLLMLQNSYGPTENSAARDAYCAIHHWDGIE